MFYVLLCVLYVGPTLLAPSALDVRHVHACVAGVLGIKVKIMLPHDPKGQTGPKVALPDHVQVVEPKDEQPIVEPYSEHKEHKKPADLAPGQMGGPAY